MNAEETIKRIAEVANAVGWQAGVGACETAGGIVSYLAAHPEMIDTFMRDGLSSLPFENFYAEGCLTFYNHAGKITTPQDLRIARTIRDLSKSPPTGS